MPAILVAGCGGSDSESSDDFGPIKVGLLHSLTGTMSISEVTVRDAEVLAIEEINAAGGVLGRQIEYAEEDGESEPATFAEKARKLINEDQVATVFGGWTSASRKAMLDVFEEEEHLLWYPVQYEGLESSPNIMYTGATTNQQIVPALDYLKEEGQTKVFLVGSDYVFPQTANKIIRAYAEANDMEIVGEEYTPLGHTEYATVISKIQTAAPDVVFNTLNGDSNVAFFKQFQAAGVGPDDIPTMSVSVAEEEVAAIGAEYLAGHLVAWNYYQTTDTPENAAFVEAFQAKYGEDRPTSDPMEAAYTAVHLWAAAVEEAGTTDIPDVLEAVAGVSYAAPEGLVTIDESNHHVAKTARIGEIGDDGQITEIWTSDGPIDPDPFLDGPDYPWASGL